MTTVARAEPRALKALSRRRLTEWTWSLDLVSPSRTRRADFPGSPDDIHDRQHRLDRGGQVLSERQFEPRLVLQPSPVRPASLTATIEGMYPLTLYLLPHPVEFALAVVQPEVLIEAPQHPCQMLLLLPPSPVAVVEKPFPRADQKLPATLDA